MKSKKGFRMSCPSCTRRLGKPVSHTCILDKCPGCGIHGVPMPRSDKVLEICHESLLCDGCEAYEDHLR